MDFTAFSVPRIIQILAIFINLIKISNLVTYCNLRIAFITLLCESGFLLEIRDIERKSRFFFEIGLDDGASDLAGDFCPKGVVALGGTANPQKSVILVQSEMLLSLYINQLSTIT